MEQDGPASPNSPLALRPGATSAATGRTRWQRLRLVLKVAELRLRFVALMAITGLTFAYWDTLANRYDKWLRPGATRSRGGAEVEYFCPMHPAVVQSELGQCPLCGMPLARRAKGETPALAAGVTARIELASHRIARAGIRTAEVAYTPLAQTLTTVGSVVFDERRLANVAARVPGQTRVETLFVNYTGKEVRAGEPLAELYSPELAQAIAELRLARRAEREAAGLQTAAARSILGDRSTLVRLSAEKLRRWGITPAQIEEILQGNRDDFRVPILSPIGGTVIRKAIVEGQEIPEGTTMFEIADLSHVWVQAQVYEHQISLVHDGQAISATVEAFPGEVFPGRVAFIPPTIDPTTRTVAVRFDLENADRHLRPGMFARVLLTTPVAETPAFRSRLAGAAPHRSARVQGVSLSAEEQRDCPVTTLKLGSMGTPVAVEIEGHRVWACCGACLPKLRAEPARYLPRLLPPPPNEVLSVPEAAVIDTGDRQVVYVEVEPGVYEGRVVTLGPRIGDRFPVLAGLAPGERVAAAGAFLIDAESRLNPAAPPQPRVEPPPTPPGRAAVGAPSVSTASALPPHQP